MAEACYRSGEKRHLWPKLHQSARVQVWSERRTPMVRSRPPSAVPLQPRATETLQKKRHVLWSNALFDEAPPTCHTRVHVRLRQSPCHDLSSSGTGGGPPILYRTAPFGGVPWKATAGEAKAGNHASGSQGKPKRLFVSAPPMMFTSNCSRSLEGIKYCRQDLSGGDRHRGIDVASNFANCQHLPWEAVAY